MPQKIKPHEYTLGNLFDRALNVLAKTWLKVQRITQKHATESYIIIQLNRNGSYI